MKELDRILGILLALQSQRRISARQMAERFGVSTRTVYRDLQTMSLLGIPIYAERGRNGGIRLLEGYFLPPLMFTRSEAIALLLGIIPPANVARRAVRGGCGRPRPEAACGGTRTPARDAGAAGADRRRRGGATRRIFHAEPDERASHRRRSSTRRRYRVALSAGLPRRRRRSPGVPVTLPRRADDDGRRAAGRLLGSWPLVFGNERHRLRRARAASWPPTA